MTIAAVASLVGLALLGALAPRLFAGADYTALCKLECACQGCRVADCVADYEERAMRQGECRDEGDAIVDCKLQPGGARCEEGGGFKLLMPSDRCLPQIDAFSDCLGRRADARAEAEKVEAPKVSFAEAMRIVCESPNKVDIESLPPSERATRLARYIEENAGNEEMEDLFGEMAGAAPERRDALFRDALARAGIDECPFFDAVQ